MDEHDLPTTYKGRDYSNAIDMAIRKARTEYLYPSSATNIGLKEIMGRKLYADLIADNICHARIPIPLKIKLIGKEKYEGCMM